MRNLYITLTFLLLLFLAACGTEETSVSAEKQIGSNTAESEYITAAADYARNASQKVKELDILMSDTENIESSFWQSDVNDLLFNLDMIDIDYVLAGNFLTDEQFAKYEATSEHFSNANTLIKNLCDEIPAASKTYDKKKIEELRKQLPSIIDELKSMREKLEVERYK